MIRSIIVAAALALVWMALWESASLGTALAGLAAGVVVVLVVPLRSEGPKPRVRPLLAVRLLVYFIRKLVVATALVAWEVITPGSRINQGIVAVPMIGVSEGLVTLVANMISLTPGTLTIEVRPEPVTLYVHVLHLRSVEEVRLEVRELEEMAIAAFTRPGERSERTTR
jgi:multicomponent Na+:H+ antiporter subunit E